MMLKEATIKNLELETYEKRLTDVKIEMEKTRRRMVALRAVDYKRKKELKEKNLRLRMSHSRVLQVVDSRARWRAKALARNVVSSCVKRQLLRSQNPSLFHGGRYKASVRQCAYRMMRDRTCRRTFDRWRVEGGEWAKECAALAFAQEFPRLSCRWYCFRCCCPPLCFAIPRGIAFMGLGSQACFAI